MIFKFYAHKTILITYISITNKTISVLGHASFRFHIASVIEICCVYNVIKLIINRPNDFVSKQFNSLF